MKTPDVFAISNVAHQKIAIVTTRPTRFCRGKRWFAASSVAIATAESKTTSRKGEPVFVILQICAARKKTPKKIAGKYL